MILLIYFDDTIEYDRRMRHVCLGDEETQYGIASTATGSKIEPPLLAGSAARLPSPCEYQARRHALPPCDLAHHGSRYQRLFDDPSLLVLAPSPSALDPENLPIHIRMTLKLALRSHPSQRPPSQQGGRRRTDTFATLPREWTSDHMRQFHYYFGAPMSGNSARRLQDARWARLGFG
jgi:hypothetical protein